jgi:hypothetical protein
MQMVSCYSLTYCQPLLLTAVAPSILLLCPDGIMQIYNHRRLYTSISFLCYYILFTERMTVALAHVCTSQKMLVCVVFCVKPVAQTNSQILPILLLTAILLIYLLVQQHSLGNSEFN